MTNPIAKAIAKIGVAMGYGSLEDYTGSSVEDMLESFASIAQEKGPASGGNDFLVPIELDNHMNPSRILIPFSDVKNALYSNENVYAVYSVDTAYLKMPILSFMTMGAESRIFMDGTTLNPEHPIFIILEDGTIDHDGS